jgi:hypothetical protein
MKKLKSRENTHTGFNQSAETTTMEKIVSMRPVAITANAHFGMQLIIMLTYCSYSDDGIDGRWNLGWFDFGSFYTSNEKKPL